MRFVVRMLHVVEKEIHDLGKLRNQARVEAATCLQGRVHTLALEQHQQFAKKRILQRRLAAGHGHAAAGVVVEGLVAQQEFRHLVGRAFEADELARVRLARRHALAAQLAHRDIARYGVAGERERAARADGDAASAPPAALGVVRELRTPRPRFRVVAPGAAQRAALEEDHRPDARSVIDGVVLDVEDNAVNAGLRLGRAPSAR